MVNVKGDDSSSTSSWCDDFDFDATASGKLSDCGAAAVAAIREASRQETWLAKLQRTPGEKLGMQVEATLGGSALVITHIHEGGQIFAWNEKHPMEHLHCGDLIMEVNGVSDRADSMQHILRTSGDVLDIRLSRNVDFPVHIDMMVEDPSASLGIQLDENFVVQYLKASGAAARQTASLPVELQLRPGDRLVAVNSRREPAAMHRLLTSETAPHIELQVQRPRPGELPSLVVAPRRRQTAARKDANEAAGLSFFEALELFIYSGSPEVEASTEECQGLLVTA